MTQYTPDDNGSNPAVRTGPIARKAILLIRPRTIETNVPMPIKEKTAISRAFPHSDLWAPTERLRVMRVDKMLKATLEDGRPLVIVGDPGLNNCISVMNVVEDILSSNRPAFELKSYLTGERPTATDIGRRLSLLMHAPPEPGAEKYRFEPNAQLLQQAWQDVAQEKRVAPDGRPLTSDEARELLMNRVVEKVRELAQSPQHRERQRIWNRDVGRNLWLMYLFIHEHLRGRKDVIFAFVQLGYQQPGGLKELQHDRDRLLNNLRGNTTLDSCFAYVWKLNTSPLKGYYLEFTFLFKQLPQIPDLSAYIADYWARLVFPNSGERFIRVSTQTQPGVPDVHTFQTLMPEQRKALATALAAHMVLSSQHVRPDVPPRTKPFGYGTFGR